MNSLGELPISIPNKLMIRENRKFSLRSLLKSDDDFMWKFNAFILFLGEIYKKFFVCQNNCSDFDSPF